jgi:hypothetical protein
MLVERESRTNRSSARKLLALGAVSALALATPATAQLASTSSTTAKITNPIQYNPTATTHPGDGTITLNFDGNINGHTVSGLSAQLTLTFLGDYGSNYYFGYSLTDTSTIASRVSGFGFDTNPDPTGGAANLDPNSLFKNLVVSTNYPNGVKQIDLCLDNDSGQGCSGSGGVVNGNPPVSGTGTFYLSFASGAPASLDLSYFHVRYQSVSSSYGTSGTGSGTIVPPIPEPATWSMMLLGFAGIGAAFRRSRRRQSRIGATIA